MRTNSFIKTAFAEDKALKREAEMSGAHATEMRNMASRRGKGKRLLGCWHYNYYALIRYGTVCLLMSCQRRAKRIYEGSPPK